MMMSVFKPTEAADWRTLQFLKNKVKRLSKLDNDTYGEEAREAKRDLNRRISELFPDN